MYQLIIFLLGFLAVFSALFFTKKKKEWRSKILKIMTVSFCTLMFVRFFLSDAFILVINGAWEGGEYIKTTDYLQLVLRWGFYTNCAVLPMAVFTDSRFFKNLAGYFSLPFSILSAVFFNDYMAYFLSPGGRGYDIAPSLRYIEFILELVLAIAIPVILHVSEKHVFAVKDKTEWKNFLFGIPAVIVTMMPTYAPQAILGYGVRTPGKLSTYHLVWLAVAFVLVMALYYLFRFRSYKDRYNLCLFLTLVLFFHYNSLYLMGVTLKRLPFQLCNIAAYFYMIAIIFKLEKMFHFCFLANVVGTLFAMVAPDFSAGNYSFWNAHFIWEHTLVLFIPALAMGLRIFPRVTRKSLKYYFVGFTAYFLFAFIVGTVINGYSDVTGERVNYFFMFDLNMAFDYFPFLKFTEDTHYVFGRFEVYPLIVLIVYAGFSLLNCLFYLGVKFFYKLEDDHLALRGSGIDLYEKITKKQSRRPKQFID